MAKKLPTKTGKAWKPGDPLKFDSATRKNVLDGAAIDLPDKADNPLFAQGGNAHQPMKPANHKSHIRQKKV
jgi:hypothetical protein